VNAGAGGPVPWWAAAEPVEVALRCEGDTDHPVRWERGGLRLLGHADPSAEAALAALGATPPRCVAVRDLWRAYQGDVALVTLGRRPGEASLGLSGPVPVAARPDQRRSALLVLLGLPLPLVDRLAVTAMAAATDRWGDEEFRRAHGLRLGAALSARALPALRRFASALTDTPAGVVAVQCAPSAPGDGPRIHAERRPDGSVAVAASLPLRWLSAVWGTGISEVGGNLVLDVVDVLDRGVVHVDVARWELLTERAWSATSEKAALRRDDGGSWQPAGPA